MWPKAVQLQTKHYGSKEELKTYISEEREGGGEKGGRRERTEAPFGSGNHSVTFLFQQNKKKAVGISYTSWDQQ